MSNVGSGLHLQTVTEMILTALYQKSPKTFRFFSENVNSISTRTQTRRNIQITKEINKTQGCSFVSKIEDEAASQIIDFGVERYSIEKISKSENFVARYSIDATETVRGARDYQPTGKLVVSFVMMIKIELIDDC